MKFAATDFASRPGWGCRDRGSGSGVGKSEWHFAGVRQAVEDPVVVAPDTFSGAENFPNGVATCTWIPFRHPEVIQKKWGGEENL
jgi:hypothetical protein